MKKPTVTISLEIHEREFVPKVLLAKALIDSGFRVYLGSTDAIDALIRAGLEPSTVFHKSTLQRKSHLYRKLGHIFVFLDEEATPATPRQMLSAQCYERYQSVNLETCDLVFFAEKRVLDKAKELNLGGGVRFEISGSPRTTVWKNFEWLFYDDVNRIQNKHGEFILFPTSFGRDVLKQYLNDKHPKQGEDVAVTALRNYVFLLEYLSLRLVHSKIILRPHPSEPVSDWKRILSGLTGIEIIRDGEITPWIMAAKSLIQWRSTSSVQASFFGKASAVYFQKQILGVTDTPAFELCKSFDSEDDLLSYLESTRPFDLALSEQTQEILNAGLPDDGLSEVERIVKILVELGRKPAEFISLGAFPRLKLYLLFKASQLKKLLKVFGLFRRQHLVSEKLPDGIIAEDVLLLVTKMRTSEKNAHDYRVRSIGTNLVVMETL